MKTKVVYENGVKVRKTVAPVEKDATLNDVIAQIETLKEVTVENSNAIKGVSESMNNLSNTIVE